MRKRTDTRAGARGRGARIAVAALALTTLVGCKPLDDAMAFAFGRSMRDQPSLLPYEHPMPAPENSVAFSAGVWDPGLGEVNLGQPGEAAVPDFTQFDLGAPGVGGPIVQGLVNPLDRNDPQALARGEEIYLRYCVVCHGPDGVGTNAYIAQYHPLLGSYNVSGAQVAGYSDAYLYAMIRVGRGLMPPYGARVSHFDRWAVVNYVRQLQLQAGTLAQAEAPAPGDGQDQDGGDR